MDPDKKTIINGVIIEEYYWNGKPMVYADNVLCKDITFDEVIEHYRTAGQRWVKSFEYAKCPLDHNLKYCKIRMEIGCPDCMPDLVNAYDVGSASSRKITIDEITTWLDNDKFESLGELHIYLDKLAKGD